MAGDPGKRRTDHSADDRPVGSFLAFSAIGSPAGFYRFLEKEGISVKAHRTFRDHHIFTANDIEKLVELAVSLNVDGFICTEKTLSTSRPNWIWISPYTSPA